MANPQQPIVVIWIDWYPYHVARFRALAEHRVLQGRMRGIELVGGAGVHSGFVFREEIGSVLPVITLAPAESWQSAGQRRLAVAIWRKLEELNPAIVLVPGYYTAPALVAALWSRIRGRRSVLMTESTEADHHRSGWKETIKSVLIRSLFDWAIAGGHAHIRYLEALRFPGNRIARNYDVVDNDFFRQGVEALRSALPAQHSEVREKFFLYVGRLAPEKNVDGLIHAFAAYRRAGGGWPLVLAGDGPERQRLEDLCISEGVTAAVEFTGHKTSVELLAYYAFAGAFVLPSTREPWGLVVNEAMASGLPVIVSKRCGCAENLVMEGVNGFTFDPAKPGELTGILMQLTRMDDRQRGTLGAKSQELVARYSPAKWADEIARIAAA